MSQPPVQGKIVYWDPNTLSGLLLPEGAETPLKVDFSDFEGQRRLPAVNQIVRFRVVSEDSGRVRLADVVIVSNRRAVQGWIWQDGVAIAFALGYLLVIVHLTRIGYLPWGIVTIYLVSSAMAFLAYWADKRASTGSLIRAKESTLHGLGLIGGWPGGLIAQRLFKNKLRKRAFQDTFWLIVVLHLAFLGVLLTPPGRMMFYNIVGF